MFAKLKFIKTFMIVMVNVEIAVYYSSSDITFY